MSALEGKASDSLALKALGIVLMLLTVALGFLAWAALMNLSLELTIRFALALPDAGSVQQSGIVRTVRTASMMCGGALWLALAIGSIGFHSQHLATKRSWKVLAWTLGIELVLIFLDLLLI